MKRLEHEGLEFHRLRYNSCLAMICDLAGVGNEYKAHAIPKGTGFEDIEITGGKRFLESLIER